MEKVIVIIIVIIAVFKPNGVFHLHLHNCLKYWFFFVHNKNVFDLFFTQNFDYLCCKNEEWNEKNKLRKKKQNNHDFHYKSVLNIDFEAILEYSQ